MLVAVDGIGRREEPALVYFWADAWKAAHKKAKEGTLLNGKRLVVNIANDMGLRLKNDLSALNRTFDCSIDNHALGCDGSGHMSPTGDDEGRAVKFAINLSIDLD